MPDRSGWSGMVAVGWLFLAVVWGTTWPAVKVGLETLPPMSFAGVRFAVAGVVLGIFVWLARLPLPRTRSEWTLLISTALVTISLQYALQFWGQQHIAAGLASLIAAMIPVFTTLFAHWTLVSEPMTRRSVAGTVCGMVGVTIIFSDQLVSEGELAFAGSVALLLAVAASSLAQVMVKKSAGTINPIVFTAGHMIVGCVPLLVAGVALDGAPWSLEWTGAGVAAVLYLALVGSALAFGVMYWLFHHVAITKVMTVGFANPVVAVFLGWWWLDERLSWRAFAGGAAVLAGVGLVLTREGGDPREPADLTVGAAHP